MNYNLDDKTPFHEDPGSREAAGGIIGAVAGDRGMGFVISDMDESWVKLYRRMEQSAIWNMKPEYLKIWIYLLFRARRTPTVVLMGSVRVGLDIGDVWTSHDRIAIDCRMPKKTVRAFIKWCSESNQIVTRKSPKGALISICNYEQLQQLGNQKVTRKSSESDQKVIHTKNKEVRSKKEDYTITDTIDRGTNSRSRPASSDEVHGYFRDLGSTDVEAATFYDHFQSNGWRVGGKAAMKDWRSAARNWVRRNNKQGAHHGKRTKGERSVEAGTADSIRELVRLDRPDRRGGNGPLELDCGNGSAVGIGKAPEDRPKPAQLLLGGTIVDGV